MGFVDWLFENGGTGLVDALFLPREPMVPLIQFSDARIVLSCCFSEDDDGIGRIQVLVYRGESKLDQFLSLYRTSFERMMMCCVLCCHYPMPIRDASANSLEIRQRCKFECDRASSRTDCRDPTLLHMLCTRDGKYRKSKTRTNLLIVSKTWGSKMRG